MKNSVSNLCFPILLISLIHGMSCTNSTEPNNSDGNPPLRLSLRTDLVAVSILLGETREITILGGSRPYRLKSNSDSTKVNAVIYNTLWLRITGNAIGKADIEVADSLGFSTLLIPVTVSDFVANPNPAVWPIQDFAYILMKGGTQPYSIKTFPDSSIATIEPNTTSSGSNQFNINAISMGATNAEIIDASSPPKTITVPIIVNQRFAPYKEVLIVHEGQKDTFSVYGGTPPYGIWGIEKDSIIAASMLGPTVSIWGIKQGETNMFFLDHSNPRQVFEVSVHVQAWPSHDLLPPCSNNRTITRRGA
jgi:hypothetical protein